MGNGVEEVVERREETGFPLVVIKKKLHPDKYEELLIFTEHAHNFTFNRYDTIQRRIS